MPARAFTDCQTSTRKLTANHDLRWREAPRLLADGVLAQVRVRRRIQLRRYDGAIDDARWIEEGVD